MKDKSYYFRAMMSTSIIVLCSRDCPCFPHHVVYLYLLIFRGKSNKLQKFTKLYTHITVFCYGTLDFNGSKDRWGKHRCRWYAKSLDNYPVISTIDSKSVKMKCWLNIFLNVFVFAVWSILLASFNWMECSFILNSAYI